MTHAPKTWRPALACGALALLSFSDVASSQPGAPAKPQPPVVRFPVEQPVALSARVALLEQKVHALQKRLEALEAPASPPVDPCDPPYTVDPKGMRSIKPECLEVRPCDPPYTVDPKGVRIPKRECF